MEIIKITHKKLIGLSNWINGWAGLHNYIMHNRLPATKMYPSAKLHFSIDYAMNRNKDVFERNNSLVQVALRNFTLECEEKRILYSSEDSNSRVEIGRMTKDDAKKYSESILELEAREVEIEVYQAKWHPEFESDPVLAYLFRDVGHVFIASPKEEDEDEYVSRRIAEQEAAKRKQELVLPQ